MKHVVYIAVGSNLGGRLANCEMAVELLGQHEDIEVVTVSHWRNTKALTLHGDKQPEYINGAVKILTELEPLKLLQVLKDIEREMGRLESYEKWSPRIIDLDILFFDDLVMDELGLKIPHPEIEKRRFVLEPLCDINPKLKHPVLKKTVEELSEGGIYYEDIY